MRESNNYERLVTVAVNAKTALLSIWDADRAFKDKGDILNKEGFLSDTIGLTSLLLMLVAFRNESQIISDSDKAHIAEVTDATIEKLSIWAAESGFNATPWLPEADSRDFFTTDVGYIDTISWVTSAAILVRYAERNQIAKFAPKTHDIARNLIASGLKQLLQSQRDDGTWGFMADKKATKSLYFTYAAGATIADFSDYVLGEIEDVERNNAGKERLIFRDEELLKYLDSAIGTDTQAAVEAAKEKLRLWLLWDCLPLLPGLSCCTTAADYTKHLGLWTHETANPFEKNGINYYNLYFTYYLIDLMVLTGTDLKYQAIVSSESEEFKALKQHYRDGRIILDDGPQRTREVKLLSDEDYAYYFSRGNAEDFWTAFVEQAIHSSRNQYMSASRTGTDFWDGRKSEIPLTWLHDDRDVQAKIKDMVKRKRLPLTDPAIAPMALRVNASYSYYICGQTDISVDRLFKNICDDISLETDAQRVKDLWDQLDYSLLVTERSIEALVDYYDYLCKFELEQTDSLETAPASPMPTTESSKSEFELMFERKIDEYLRSDAGREIIREQLGSLCPTGTTSSAVAEQATNKQASELLSIAEYILALVSHTDLLNKKGADEDRLIYTLVEVVEELKKCALKELIRSKTKKEPDEIDSDYTRRIHDASNKFIKRYKSLLNSVVQDLDKSSGDFKALYEKLMSS